jgi:hypothetical protein
MTQSCLKHLGHVQVVILEKYLFIVLGVEKNWRMRMKRKKTEQHFGVPPEELNSTNSIFSKYRDFFTTHKSAKKGQNSFRITKSLLENLISTSLKIQKEPKLIISIADGSDEYTITCLITKNKPTAR